MRKCPKCRSNIDKYSNICVNCGWMYNGNWRFLKFIFVVITAIAVVCFFISKFF